MSGRKPVRQNSHDLFNLSESESESEQESEPDQTGSGPLGMSEIDDKWSSKWIAIAFGLVAGIVFYFLQLESFAPRDHPYFGS